MHGGTGDDSIYGGGGNDRIFGDAGDDDIIGGWGNDWISGGTGSDGILGDDGRIFTSRNTAVYGESDLYGIVPLLANDPDTRTSQGNVLNEFIYTPGQMQTETINVGGKLKKSWTSRRSI
jgi:Ca2+-binding RTX toxin-like protein